jgi:hypothetical protein
MIVVNGLLAGTFAIAATRVVVRRRRRNLMYWLAAPEQTPFEGRDEQALNEINRRVETSYRFAGYSLGISVIGLLFYPPLGWVSVPLTLYSALPLFERTLDNAIDRFEINADVFSTTVLSVSLIVENYFFASLLQWLYALNERAAFRISERIQRYFDPNTPSFDWAGFFDQLQARWRVQADVIVTEPVSVRYRGKPDDGNRDNPPE